MIYTITFNPAIDYVVNVSNYCEGKVNRTTAEKIMPGGKGINVSVVLKNLGIENTALGFKAGFTGDEIERLLRNDGIKTDFIPLKDGCSRINIKLKAKTETEINAQGPQIDADAINDLYEKLYMLCDGDFLVLAGSIPKGLPDTMYCDIMRGLSGKKINFVVDAEKTLLEAVLEYKPFLIKPNHHELGEIFGRQLTDKVEIARCAKELQKRGARNVFVSMAGEGGILAAESGDVMYTKAPEGKVINSTGAGDSAVAGFIAGYMADNDLKKAFLTGICAGSASAFSTELATKEEILSLMHGVRNVEYMEIRS